MLQKLPCSLVIVTLKINIKIMILYYIIKAVITYLEIKIIIIILIIKIIQRWNVKYQVEKKEEERRKRNKQSKIDLAIIEQKLTMGKRFDEDEKRNNGYKIIRKERERERRYLTFHLCIILFLDCPSYISKEESLELCS